MDLKLPNWVRLVILVSALMQLGFGLTLLIDPDRIAELWPWKLPPLTARLLGASTLVSVPMALLVVWINRFAVAAIPLVMMLTYRVLQLLAGGIHHDRFAPDSLVTWNYFGGGLLMAATFAFPLIAARRGGLPSASPSQPFAQSMPWIVPGLARTSLAALGALYLALGLAFLIAGAAAKPLWFDAAGLTPLTARLFASPLTGLGLGTHSRFASEGLARDHGAGDRHGDHRHCRQSVAGARLREFRAAEQSCLARRRDAADPVCCRRGAALVEARR